MIIIGVDPGTRFTGFGIIEFSNNQYHVIDYGVIRPPTNAPLEKRYLAIFTSLEHLIEKYKPSCLAVETQFVGKNVQSAIKLGMARGVSILAAARAQLEVKEYSPTMTKKAVVGRGHASKEQVIKMIQILLNIDQEIKEDAADALAIALCHIHSLNLNTKIQAIKGR
ncbi:MAG: Crossover junction endodeoxyribonuclease RuvC [Chlamydiae bacterium]|nr:Crossover junction endodeoxyribonuclease RuvC [Chlamydiota bacterium]